MKRFCKTLLNFHLVYSHVWYGNCFHEKEIIYQKYETLLKSLFNKVTGLKSCNFIKERLLTQLFSCEYCEIFKNNFFIKYLSWLLLKVWSTSEQFFTEVMLFWCRYFYLTHCSGVSNVWFEQVNTGRDTSDVFLSWVQSFLWSN